MPTDGYYVTPAWHFTARPRQSLVQYCLVKSPGVWLLTFTQRHAREIVDNSLMRVFRFHFRWYSDSFTLWVKPRLVWQLFRVSG
jgi:hypothetical protein